MDSSSVSVVVVKPERLSDEWCSVFWGAAIVLFLAKIINLHNPLTQGFWVEISSQVENGKSQFNRL